MSTKDNNNDDIDNTVKKRYYNTKFDNELRKYRLRLAISVLSKSFLHTSICNSFY